MGPSSPNGSALAQRGFFVLVRCRRTGSLQPPYPRLDLTVRLNRSDMPEHPVTGRAKNNSPEKGTRKRHGCYSATIRSPHHEQSILVASGVENSGDRRPHARRASSQVRTIEVA